MMMASSSAGGAGDLDQARIVERVVLEDRLAMLDRPPRQALAPRDREAEHGLRVALAGEHRLECTLVLVDAVDAEVVVPDHALQAVGDQLEDACGLEGREQLLVDLEQAPLRVGLARKRRRLLAQLLVQARVGDGDRGLAGQHLEQLGIRGSNASRAWEWTVSEPMAPSSPMSGALMTERMPCWRM